MRYLYRVETAEGIVIGCAEKIECHPVGILIWENQELSMYPTKDIISFTIDRVEVSE